MNSAIILIIVACLIILYAVIRVNTKSSRTSNGQYHKTCDDKTDNSLSATVEISTANSFLHEQELNKTIYIVKQVFFKPGNTNEEAYSSEKVFDKGSGVLRNSNERRLKEAQKYFDFTCQNILFKKSLGNMDETRINLYTVTLSCVQNIDGIIKTTILKKRAL